MKPLLFLLCVTLAGSVGAGSRDNVVLDHSFRSVVVSTDLTNHDSPQPFRTDEYRLGVDDKPAYCVHEWVYTRMFIYEAAKPEGDTHYDDIIYQSEMRVPVQMCQKCGVLRVRP